MTEPVNLAAKRWEKGDRRPGAHSVREMLEVVIAKIDSGELDAQHAILIWGTECDGVGDDGYFQAGSFGPYAQVGLLARGLALIKGAD